MHPTDSYTTQLRDVLLFGLEKQAITSPQHLSGYAPHVILELRKLFREGWFRNGWIERISKEVWGTLLYDI